MGFKRAAMLPLMVLLFLAGCRVGPRYHTPIVEVTPEWKGQQEEPCCTAFRGLWWHVFDDPVLNDLECQAVANNRDLYVALDRVAQARALAGVARSDLYPQFSLDPAYGNIGQLFKIYLPNVNPSPFGSGFPTIYRVHILEYTMPVNMQYEIDLWGKICSQYDSAVYNVQSVEDNFQSALLTLTTDLATAYFKLRSFDATLEVLEENLTLLEGSLALTESRFAKGLTGEQDVLAARQEYYDNEAAFFDTKRQRLLQENAIATLMGMSASEFCLPPMPLEEEPPSICAGCPSEVLMQRPDISAAERMMASTHASIGVAYASFFPSVTLTGTLGFSSPDLSQFLSWKSRLWAYGVNASLPILDGGFNLSTLYYAYGQYWEAAHTYEQKVLQAFQEVEDALVNVEMQAKQYHSYELSDEAASKRVKLSINRYKNGLTNYLEVLDSERQAIGARVNRVNVLGFRYLAAIQLVKSVGGSWNLPCTGQNDIENDAI